MNPYLDFVKRIQSAVLMAREIEPPQFTSAPIESHAKVLLFSPHPDDECITGALPLRLMRELGKQIINVPITFGSNIARQSERAAELSNACGYLGWGCYREPDGLSPLTSDDVAQILDCLRPEVVFMPHIKDWNPRHISTHTMVVDALKLLGNDFCCKVVETEYWGAMEDPNLLVEVDAKTVADLVAATSLHLGEVRRNPYHLLLPAWMQDNVRRGGELVGGPGTAAPPFEFATLYRMRRWESGNFVSILDHGVFAPMGLDNLKEIF